MDCLAGISERNNPMTFNGKTFIEVTTGDFNSFSPELRAAYNKEWWRLVTDGPITDDAQYDYDQANAEGWGNQTTMEKQL